MSALDLTAVKKRLEGAVNFAKEKEMQSRKKANAVGKKKSVTAKVGGAIDSYGDEDYDDGYSGGGGGGAAAAAAPAEEDAVPFSKPKFSVEECVRARRRFVAAGRAPPPALTPPHPPPSPFSCRSFM